MDYDFTADSDGEESSKNKDHNYDGIWKCNMDWEGANEIKDFGQLIDNAGGGKCGFLALLRGLKSLGHCEHLQYNQAESFRDEFVKYSEKILKEMEEENVRYFFGLGSGEGWLGEFPFLLVSL